MTTRRHPNKHLELGRRESEQYDREPLYLKATKTHPKNGLDLYLCGCCERYYYRFRFSWKPKDKDDRGLPVCKVCCENY